MSLLATEAEHLSVTPLQIVLLPQKTWGAIRKKGGGNNSATRARDEILHPKFHFQHQLSNELALALLESPYLLMQDGYSHQYPSDKLKPPLIYSITFSDPVAPSLGGKVFLLSHWRLQA